MSLINNKETDELAIIYPYDVSVDMLNGSSIMKPCGYQTIMGEVAEKHLRYLNLTEGELAKYGMAWVLISASFDIINPIHSAIRVLGHTWHSEQKGLTFRRDFAFTDEAGNPLFNASTFSVLLDLNTRKIIKPVNMPFDLGSPVKEFSMEASSRFRNKTSMSPCDSRKIYPSYIDAIGHTNNCRYSEFAYDAFNESEIENLDKMSRLDLYFISELRLGDKFTVRRGIEKGGALIIDGVKENTSKESFACRIEFKK